MNAKYSLTPSFLAKALPPCFLDKSNRILYLREEKSLRHVVMVANFWMTTNRKHHKFRVIAMGHHMVAHSYHSKFAKDFAKKPSKINRYFNENVKQKISNT